MTPELPELAATSVSGQVNAQNGSYSVNNVTVVSELFVLESSASTFTTALNPASEVPLSAFDDYDTADFDKTTEIASSESVCDPDEKLVKAFLSGSEEAFIQLYAKYESPLLLYCKRMLHNEWIAEDIFQEIWIRVFELRLRKGIVIDHFSGLLYRSAKNLCLNSLRTERSRGTGSLLEENEKIPVEEASSRETSQREIQSLMLQALNKLPFDQREAFVLHEYSGLSFGDIADILRTSEMNVKVRAYRARLRLRKFIQGWLRLGETDDPVNYI